jgi:hypothetical protein
MLGPMDTGAAAWIVVGFLLGVAVLTLAGLALVVVRGRRRTPPDPPAEPGGWAVDDLPGFLESPPGAGPAVGPTRGWTALSSPPPPPPPAPTRRSTPLLLSGAAVTALALLGAAAVIATVDRPSDRGDRHHSASDSTPRAFEARLAFAGIVLEQRAVGVTAAYPRLEVTTEDGEPVARLELPAFNCLAAEAPDDPAAAGCTATVTEYADLAAPDLRVERDGDGWAVSGSFPTERRPNGGPAEPTGRSYELRVTVVPADGRSGGRRPAEAVLHLGEDRAPSVDGEISGG